LALAGISGMYLYQVKKIGVLGLIGYLFLGTGYLLIASTTMIAAHVLPAIAGTDPAYVSDVIAISTAGPPPATSALCSTCSASRTSPTWAWTHLRHRVVPGS
jgi:hypothetical protein